MAGDLGHFTLNNNVVVDSDKARANIELRHPQSNDIILSLSTEAAWDLGHRLITDAFKIERQRR